MKEVLETLRRSVQEAEQNGHKTILFPVADAKLLLEGQKQATWNVFPNECMYDDKKWNILSIDMQGGFFDLHNWEDGMLENVDMDQCKPIEE